MGGRAQGAVGYVTASSVVAGTGLAVGSGVVAICAALVSRSAWRAGALTLPWGLMLAVVGSVSLVMIARTLAGRGLGFAAAAGWLGGVGAVLVWHPGGDYLFANDMLGVSFLLVATAGVLGAAGLGGPGS